MCKRWIGAISFVPILLARANAQQSYPPLMRMAFAITLLLGLARQASLAGQTEATKPETGKVDVPYQQSFNRWKAELVDDLKQNWLTLVGLYWLKPGTNTFGSDAGNSIVLPSGSAPARAGEFELRGKDVSVKMAPGVKATIGGKQESEAALTPDISGEPTVIELSSLRMNVIVRGERIGIRAKDLNSPAAKNYRGPTFFPLDLTYRITAAWVPSDGKKTVDVPNVLGYVTPTLIAGQETFKINGQELTSWAAIHPKACSSSSAMRLRRLTPIPAAGFCKPIPLPTAQWCSTSTELITLPAP